MKLIINADDFGYSPGINRGILFGFRRGAITSTSLMINQPFTAEALQMIKAYPDLQSGLHINLTRGRPVSDIRDVGSLIDEKGYFKKAEYFYGDSILADEVEKEILAQIKCFIEAGLEPTHLDAHQHVHRHFVVMQAMIKVANIYNIPVRNIDQKTRSLLIKEKISTPDYFIADFFNKGATLKNLQKILSSLVEKYPRGVVEIMTHPAFNDGNPQKSSYYAKRSEELQILCSKEMREMLRELRIEPAGYSILNPRFN